MKRDVAAVSQGTQVSQTTQEAPNAAFSQGGSQGEQGNQSLATGSLEFPAAEGQGELSSQAAATSSLAVPPWQTRSWEKYRLTGQAHLLRAEGNSLERNPLKLKRRDADAPKIKPDTRIWGLNLTEFCLVIAACFGFVALLLIFSQTATLQTLAFLALIALIPLFVIALVFELLERWVPLPKRFPFLAFLCGAGIATALAVFANSTLMVDATYYTGNEVWAEVITSVVVAPLTEEGFKGICTLFILLLARRYVVSPLNGVMIGAMAAAGFAFVENIEYFSEGLSQGTAMLGITFFMRAVMSPFVHPMATSMIGLFMALAILKDGKWWSWTWRLVTGQVLAMSIHALWNGLASVTSNFYFVYLLVEMPLFIVWMVSMQTAASRQPATIAAGLAAYRETEWIIDSEIHMVCTPEGRKHARKWARKVSPRARRAVRSFRINAGRVGLNQVRLAKGKPNRYRMEEDRRFLSEMIEARRIFLEEGEKYAKSLELERRRNLQQAGGGSSGAYGGVRGGANPGIPGKPGMPGAPGVAPQANDRINLGGFQIKKLNW